MTWNSSGRSSRALPTYATDRSLDFSGQRPQSASAPARQQSRPPVRKISVPARYTNTNTNTNATNASSESLPVLKKHSVSLTNLDRAEIATYSRDNELQRRRRDQSVEQSSQCKTTPRGATALLDVNSNPCGFSAAESSRKQKISSTSVLTVSRRIADGQRDRAVRSAHTDQPTLHCGWTQRPKLSAYEKCLKQIEKMSHTSDMRILQFEGVVSKSIRRYMHTVAELKARFSKLSVIREEMDLHPAMRLDRWTPT